MNEEVVKILEMVKNGRLTPEEGEKLIAAVKNSDGEREILSSRKKSMFRVRVDVKDPDEKENTRVNVNIPLELAKKMSGLVSMIPKEAKNELLDQGIDLDGINLPELFEMFENGEIEEELVHVESGDDIKGAMVRVYVD